MNTKKYNKSELKFLDKQWAKGVKDRDEKCVVCNSRKMLNAHHIIPREIKFTRHMLNNGITLCPKHHKFSLELSAHRNPLMFFDWMLKNRPEQIMYLRGIGKFI